MTTDISEHEKDMEKITKDIERKNTDLNKLREKITQGNKDLENLAKKKLETAKIIEEEKGFKLKKEALITAVEKEAKIDDSLKTFYEDSKGELSKLGNDDDLKKIKEKISEHDGDLGELKNEVERREKEHAENSEALKKAEEAVKSEEETIANAFAEISKLPLEIKAKRQELSRYKKFIEIAIDKKEPSKIAFYLDEIEKTVKMIEDLGKSKDEIIPKLDRSKLKDAKNSCGEARKKLDESLNIIKNLKTDLENKTKDRAADILKKIEAIFPK